MNNFYTLYNNEALISRTLCEILIIQKKIDISRLFFLTLILLNDNIRDKISGFNLIEDSSTFFAACSKDLSILGIEFEILLPTLINSLTILTEENLIILNNKDIVYLGTREISISKSVRLRSIIKCIPRLVNILNTATTDNIANKLHIRL